MDRRKALQGLGIGALGAGAGVPGLATDADAQEVRGRVNTRSEPSQLKITDLRVVARRGATRTDPPRHQPGPLGLRRGARRREHRPMP